MGYEALCQAHLLIQNGEIAFMNNDAIKGEVYTGYKALVLGRENNIEDIVVTSCATLAAGGGSQDRGMGTLLVEVGAKERGRRGGREGRQKEEGGAGNRRRIQR